MVLTPRDIVLPEVPCDGGLHIPYTVCGKPDEPLSMGSDTFWSEIQGYRVEEWQQTVSGYEANPQDVYYAWHYLNSHPAFWKFREGPSARLSAEERHRREHPTPEGNVFRRAWWYLTHRPATRVRAYTPTSPEPISLAERIHERNLEHESGIHRCVDISVAKVNPETRSTEDEPQTETEVWIELGQQSWPEEPNNDPNRQDRKYHDYMLDCGGPTIDAAIIEAAWNVHTVYGNDRRVCDAPYDEKNYDVIRAKHAMERAERHGGLDDDLDEDPEEIFAELDTAIANGTAGLTAPPDPKDN